MNEIVTSFKDLHEITKTLKLLYVEDDITARDLIAKGIFASLFADVAVAKDGIEGFEKFKESKPDIIITDINMPRLNGLGMVRLIKEIDKKTPIIILSAHSEINYFLESIELNIDGYILKPIKESAIVSVIYKCAKNLLDAKELDSFRARELAKKELMIDYQKNKIDNYNKLLEELLFIRYSNKKELNETKEYLKSDSLLSKEEVELLRNRRGSIISAKQYLEELGEIQEEIEPLRDIELELIDSINDFEESRLLSDFSTVCAKLEEYIRYMRLLFEFEALASALASLHSFLSGLSNEEIEKNSSKLMLYIRNIHTDLSDWREKIFVSKSAKDIHYLDSSLFSSILQIEMDVKANLNSEGNDVELF